jgi:DNA-binding FrmR family transcriptional regulator
MSAPTGMTCGTRSGTKGPVRIPLPGTTLEGGDRREEAPMRGYTDDTAALLKRLRRIEGQVRGLQRMVEADAYCIDILTQISAATRALEAVALQLLDGHLRHCVTEAAAAGEPDVQAKVTEATEAIRRLVRS